MLTDQTERDIEGGGAGRGGLHPKIYGGRERQIGEREAKYTT